MSLSHDLTTTLAQFLDAHGLRTRSESEWLVPVHPGPRWRADVSRVPGTEHVFQLDVHLSLADGRILTESCAVYNRDRDAATGLLFKKFTTCSLHVLLSAFHGIHVPQQVEIEHWQVGADAWSAHVGPLLYDRSHAVDAVPFPALIDAVRDAFVAARASRRPHWVRVFRGVDEGHAPTLELLFDNDTWDVANPRFEGLAWPRAPGYLSLRLFVALTPVSG
jgi:hypothetical protein